MVFVFESVNYESSWHPQNFVEPFYVLPKCFLDKLLPAADLTLCGIKNCLYRTNELTVPVLAYVLTVVKRIRVV